MAPPKLPFFLLPAISFFVIEAAGAGEGTASKFTATFFFGDSTVDTGNNAHIRPKVFVKANHAPYANGRFSNGKLVPDLLTSAMGLKQLSPPFLDHRLTNSDLATGVSFGSAGSGYDEATSNATGALSISRQAELFGLYLARLRNARGPAEAARIVSGALVVVSSGSFDLAKEYLSGEKDGGAGETFAVRLLEKLQVFLDQLYRYGLRNFVVAGAVPIGCTPFVITVDAGDNPISPRCVEKANELAANFDSELANLLPNVQRLLPGSRFEHLSLYNVLTDIIRNASNLGFVESSKGCCGSGMVEVGQMCTASMATCGNPASFVFFDAFHTTESVNAMIADNIMKQILPKLLQA